MENLMEENCRNVCLHKLKMQTKSMFRVRQSMKSFLRKTLLRRRQTENLSAKTENDLLLALIGLQFADCA